MVLNKKVVAKVLCAAAALVGIAMLIPCAVSLLYKEIWAAESFLICAVPMILIGILASRAIGEPEKTTLGLRDGFFIVASAWLMLTLLGALPFVISGAIPSLVDAFFETASGFSTTGASILTDIESLPQGMLFWRSFTHWIGGMGILVLTIAILPALGIGGQKIMRAETTGPSMDKITFTFNDSARSLYLIYTVMTLIEAALLLVFGMNLFDSLIITFGTMGTGGFANYANSCAGFNDACQMIISFFMMLAGINFNLYYLAVSKKAKQALHDREMQVYVAIVAGATLFILSMLLISGQAKGIWEAFKLSYFQVCSIMTTTGYATCDFDLWPVPCRFVLMLLMLIGGCASSTGGGIKVIRFILGVKIGARAIRRRLHPQAVTTIKLAGKTVPEATIRSVSEFLMLYFATLALGTVVIGMENVSLVTAFSAVLACVSNIGPGFEAVGPTMNFSFFSDFSKMFLSVMMIAGRVELYTIFLLFTPSFWSKR